MNELMTEAEKIGSRNLLSIGMDGPNVNIKLQRDMSKKLKDQWGTVLLDVGSCGLHVCHNAFRDGHKKAGWVVSSFLSSLYWFFHQTATRRADYQLTSGMYNDVL